MSSFLPSVSFLGSLPKSDTFGCCIVGLSFFGFIFFGKTKFENGRRRPDAGAYSSMRVLLLALVDCFGSSFLFVWLFVLSFPRVVG